MLKKFLVSAAVVMSTVSHAIAEEVSDLVAVVTSSQPQIQLMSMVLSVQAAQQGVNVHVLLCGAAGDMALKDAPEAVTAPQPPLNVSPQTFMTILAANENTTIEVCALYLPGKNIQQTDLLEGIGVASPGDMAALLTTGSARVISF
ncbi:MAG: hypothetical protein AAFQ09_10030 [Pseudomonadota bacterium]